MHPSYIEEGHGNAGGIDGRQAAQIDQSSIDHRAHHSIRVGVAVGTGVFVGVSAGVVVGAAPTVTLLRVVR